MDTARDRLSPAVGAFGRWASSRRAVHAGTRSRALFVFCRPKKKKTNGTVGRVKPLPADRDRSRSAGSGFTRPTVPFVFFFFGRQNTNRALDRVPAWTARRDDAHRPKAPTAGESRSRAVSIANYRLGGARTRSSLRDCARVGFGFAALHPGSGGPRSRVFFADRTNRR